MPQSSSDAEPGPPDPGPKKRSRQNELKLNSFLRNADAIIAAERGLNSNSRLKLESLARHQKISKSLFAEAMEQLQARDEKPTPLTRYEQEFSRRLASELKRLRSGVISVAMELNAIELARTKYQIPPARAEQLIQQQAELASVGRISRQEAANYANQFIAQRVGQRHSLDEALHHDLYRYGRRHGLSNDQVDVIVLALLELNRKRRNRTKMKWLLATLGLVTFVSGVAVWLAGWTPLNSPLLVSDVQGVPIRVLEALPLQPQPSWVSASTNESILRFANQETGSTVLTDSLGDDDPEKRKTGYRALIEIFCKWDLKDRIRAEKLFCQLYYEEPDDEAALAIIDSACQIIRLPNEGLSIPDSAFEHQKNAVQLLATAYYFSPANIDAATLNARQSHLADRLLAVAGVDPDGKTLSQTVQEFQTVMAIDQWNFLIKNRWSAPGRAATLVTPLLNSSRTYLSENSLRNFQKRLTFGILEADARQWRYLETSITDLIATADHRELNDWVSLFQSETDVGFRQFLAPLLVEKANLQSASSRQSDLAAAINQYATDTRNLSLQPCLTRNKLIGQLTQELAGPSQQSLKRSLKFDPSTAPDRIAQLALVTNLNLALCQKIRHGNVDDPDGYPEIDQWLEQPKIRLREMVSLPENPNSGTIRAAPTASDNRRKDEAFKVLKNPDPEFSGRRIQALEQLEKIAPRFDDCSHAQAAFLATYFFSNWPDEEALNIQRRISSFQHWPSVGLAVADQTALPQTTQEQALTIARLLFGQEFSIAPQTASWRDSLQRQLILAVGQHLESQTKVDPNSLHGDWNRLPLLLTPLLRQRHRLVLDSPTTDNSSSLENANTPSDVQLATIAQQLAEARLPVATIGLLQRAKILVQEQTLNDIEKTIMATQLTYEILSATGESNPRFKQYSRQLSLEVASALEDNRSLAEQLYVVNLGLLKLVACERETLVEGLLK